MREAMFVLLEKNKKKDELPLNTGMGMAEVFVK